MPKKGSSKVAELTEHLQRLQAEFDNFRKRAEVQRADFIGLAKQEIFLEILPLVDNLDRAVAHLPKELTDNDWAKGVTQIAKQAEEALQNLGIAKIPALGQPFNPHLHEAVEDLGGRGKNEVVVAELLPGYQMNGRVLRHAVVKVAKK